MDNSAKFAYCYVKTADGAAECGDYDSSFEDIFPDDAGIFISSPNPLFSFICGEQQLKNSRGFPRLLL